MLTVYIACLIFGGVLVAISLLTGGDSSAAADHSFGEAHVDTDTGALEGHVSIEHDVAATHDVTVDHGMDADHALDHVHPAEAVRFLSFRNIVFFMAFFGLTGTILTLLFMPGFLTFFASAGIGTFSAYVGYRLMKYLKRSESGSAVHLAQLRGHIATVTLDCARDVRGKVQIATGGQTLQLVARVAEEASKDRFASGEKVIISRIEQGTAFIIEGDLLE